MRMPMSRYARVLLVTGLALLVYVASFIFIRWTRPEFINTNDGPIAIYRLLYWPIRWAIATRPPYVSRFGAKSFNAKYEGGTSGSHVDFVYEGLPYSPYCSKVNPSLQVGSLARFSYDAELSCDDAFVDNVNIIITNVVSAVPSLR